MTTVTGYAALWGNPQERDLYKEYFTPETRFHAQTGDVFPLLYTPDVKIGAAILATIDAYGVKVEATCDNEPMGRAVAKLLDRRDDLTDGYTLSLGSIPSMVKIDPSGRIVEWPIASIWLTPVPADPRLKQRVLEALS